MGMVYRNNDDSAGNFTRGSYVNGADKYDNDLRDGTHENHQLNNDKKTIEQLVDLVQADLTFSGLMPKVLPDIEIERLIKESAMQWFYKNYQWAVIKSYYLLRRDFINSEYYTSHGYIQLPEDVENVVCIYNINDPSMFRVGLQAPNLSIGLGVSNQPYLTSFVSSVGDLSVYRQILSAFSDEVNKLAKNYNRYSFNPESKRMNLLGELRNDVMLEVYVRIEQDELFNIQLFKDYCIALSKKRLGEMLQRVTFTMPGNFQYNSAELVATGQEGVDKIKEEVKLTSPNNSFFIMKR